MAGPFSGTVAIRAMKDGDFQAVIYPGTEEGLQAAIDSLGGGKGKVIIGPGTLDVTTVVSIHSGCHLQGCGPGQTVIRRAIGSLTSGDAANSGNLIMTTPYGENGLFPSSSAHSTDSITISELCLDGNQSNFGAVNPATPEHFGIRARFVDSLSISNVWIKEFLQTGIGVDETRKSRIVNCRITNPGQYASASSRNGVSYNNNLDTAGTWATDAVITNCIFESPKDSHILVNDFSNVAISNCRFYGGQIGLEIEGEGVAPLDNISMSNVVAEDLTLELLRCNLGNAANDPITANNITVSNCVMEAHSSSHVGHGISVINGRPSIVNNLRVDNCVFRKLNSSDSATLGGFYLNGTGTTTPSTNIAVTNCTFVFGNPTSARTDCYGIYVQGYVDGLLIAGCTVKSPAGQGISLNPGASGRIVTNAIIQGCYIEDTAAQGIACLLGAGAGVLKNVLIASCTVRDSNRNTVQPAAIDIGASNTTASCSYIHVSNCRAYRTGSNDMRWGVRLFQSGSTVCDNIYLTDNDFFLVSTAPYSFSGAPTNIHLKVHAGKGSNIASAATIAIPTDGDVFHVTGNTNITNGITVNPWDNGRRVYLIFDSTPTVSDTGTSKLRGAFVATADDVLPLVCDGTNWYQAAFESVN